LSEGVVNREGRWSLLRGRKGGARGFDVGEEDVGEEGVSVIAV
jgi:hypothetical protein